MNSNPNQVDWNGFIEPMASEGELEERGRKANRGRRETRGKKKMERQWVALAV